MGKMSRTKGATWEREVVNTAKAFGLDARRTAPNQTQDGSDTYGDVTIEGLKCECKHHAVVPQWVELVNCALLEMGFRPKKEITGWIADHYAVIIKRTGGWVPLVIIGKSGWYRVITMRTFFEELQNAKETRADA
jgi:hypothetical protein